MSPVRPSARRAFFSARAKRSSMSCLHSRTSRFFLKKAGRGWHHHSRSVCSPKAASIRQRPKIDVVSIAYKKYNERQSRS
jgi:hypothetical protein